ncbi:hypothetical protein Anapl_07837 [Anas platyrhynchos]|uniref:Uncharacterized protein n=1 Tax=Anas platyrhynchos TaxID=8839 RepID=R0LM64_ANAPL|nr:hypothetical protein Anapl_07837 [Anas platyrhynchos]
MHHRTVPWDLLLGSHGACGTLAPELAIWTRTCSAEGDQLRSWRMRFDYSYRLSEKLRGLAADNTEFPVLVMARGRRKRAGARMGSRAGGMPCAIQSHSL